jgi:hypothetical protein
MIVDDAPTADQRAHACNTLLHDRNGESVTHFATAWGFHHLGRFRREPVANPPARRSVSPCGARFLVMRSLPVASGWQ